MTIDISDEIDRSFGEGPAIDDDAILLERGHRALRRRRLGSGGVLLAGAVLAVSVSIAVGSGPGDRGTAPVGPPASSATPSPDAPAQTPQDTRVDGVVLVPDPSLRRLGPVDLAPDGSVHVRPGVRVTDAIPNPFERIGPSTSAAVIYVVGGETHWYVGYLDEDSGGAAATMPADDSMGFRAWVDDQRSIQGDTSTDPPSAPGTWPGIAGLDVVRFDGQSERLRPLDAVTMVEQRAHPDLPEGWAGPGDRSAVAEVRFEGVRYYVLARSTAGSDPQYIAVKASRGGATLDDFLDEARTRYAEGGGGLL